MEGELGRRGPGWEGRISRTGQEIGRNTVGRLPPLTCGDLEPDHRREFGACLALQGNDPDAESDKV